jgi:hypothetical protein
MIDLSDAREFVPVYGPIAMIVLTVLIGGIVLFVFRDESDGAHRTGADFFKRMGGALIAAILIGGVTILVEMLVWESAFNPDEILKREAERVYGITFDKGDSSDFGVDSPALGTDADGNRVLVRYNSETNELETVKSWTSLPPK